jgi:hypothetical protein
MGFKQGGYDAGEGTGSSRKEVRQEKRAARVSERGAAKANRVSARTEKKVSRINARAEKVGAKGASKVAKVTTKSTAKAEKISPAKVAKPVVKPVSRAKKLTVAKTIKKVATKRGTGNTYKSSWDAMSADKKAGYKGGYGDFETKAKDWNKKNDAKKRASGGNAATKHSLSKKKPGAPQ